MKRAPVAAIDARRQSAAIAFSRRHDFKPAKGPTKTLLQSHSGNVRFCVIVSKRINSTAKAEDIPQRYWYVYHPRWDAFLRDCATSFLILACLDRTAAYAIPYAEFAPLLDKLGQTKTPSRHFWHIPIVESEQDGLCIKLLSRTGRFALTPYQFSIR